MAKNLDSTKCKTNTQINIVTTYLFQFSHLITTKKTYFKCAANHVLNIAHNCRQGFLLRIYT